MNVFESLAIEIDNRPEERLAALLPEGFARVARNGELLIGMLKHVDVVGKSVAVLFELDDYVLGQSLGIPLLLTASDQINTMGSIAEYFSDTHPDWDLMVAAKENIPDTAGLLPVVRAVHTLKGGDDVTAGRVQQVCGVVMRDYTARRLRASSVVP